MHFMNNKIKDVICVCTKYQSNDIKKMFLEKKNKTIEPTSIHTLFGLKLWFARHWWIFWWRNDRLDYIKKPGSFDEVFSKLIYFQLFTSNMPFRWHQCIMVFYTNTRPYFVLFIKHFLASFSDEWLTYFDFFYFLSVYFVILNIVHKDAYAQTRKTIVAFNVNMTYNICYF